jgi:hypothetical protein
MSKPTLFEQHREAEGLAKEEQEEQEEIKKEQNSDKEDEEYIDFLQWNKSDLRKEFAENFHCFPDQVEEFYPDDFDEFCRKIYKEDNK